MGSPVDKEVQDALDRLANFLYTHEFVGDTDIDAAQEALATVRQALAAKDAWSERAFDQQKQRAEAAEAEVQRLREGLREVKGILAFQDEDGDWCVVGPGAGLQIKAIQKIDALLADSPDGADEWFIPEGDRVCGVVHRDARATCMKRRGHEGSHATPQGTWIDGPWCEYPPLRGGAK